jgi:hypothetical protein
MQGNITSPIIHTSIIYDSAEKTQSAALHKS